MAKALSPDLRLRIIRAVEEEGMSCRGAAGRFGVAPSTAIELVSEWRSTGACEAGAQGGDRRSARIEGHAAEICKSAWGPHADRRAKSLIQMTAEGHCSAPIYTFGAIGFSREA